MEDFHPETLPGVANDPFLPFATEDPVWTAAVGKAGGGSVSSDGTSTRSRSATQIFICGGGFYDQLGLPSQSFQLLMVDDNGAPVPNTGGVIMSRLACLGSDGLYHLLQIQEVEDCDADGNKYYRLALVSDRYDPH